jgi:sodium-dependent dicarboxylate transporter 2/3/5
MFWKSVHLFIGIVVFSLIVLAGMSDIAWSIGITFIMVYWWITQPIPIYITALLPMIVGPASGLISDFELSSSYGNKMVFLFLGGFILAIGLEKWKLHNVFAESLISAFGNTPKRILLGFMVSTAFLSMWISNTATALMMMPMAMAVIHSIPRFRLKKRFSIALLLSIAFAANIGGTATLIGTPPNIQMAAILESQFNVHISFIDWMLLAFPFMVFLLLISFFLIATIFLKNISFETQVFKKQKLNGNQLKVLFVFVSAVILWIAKDGLNLFLPFQLNDMMIALFTSLILFILNDTNGERSILVWSDMKKIPWGILFLFGGGLALAKILSNSGSLDLFIVQLKSLTNLGFFGVLCIICLFTIFATELMSNLALVSLLIPIMGEFALDAGYPIVSICSGIALSASCAFMLPVATPPNAIIFSSNLIKVNTMAKVGLVLNLLTVLLVVTLIYLTNAKAM